MKKTYLAPSCRVKHIGTETILAGSGNGSGSVDVITTPIDKTPRTDDFTAGSKPAIWKDWDNQ